MQKKRRPFELKQTAGLCSFQESHCPRSRGRGPPAGSSAWAPQGSVRQALRGGLLDRRPDRARAICSHSGRPSPRSWLVSAQGAAAFRAEAR